MTVRNFLMALCGLLIVVVAMVWMSYNIATFEPGSARMQLGVIVPVTVAAIGIAVTLCAYLLDRIEYSANVRFVGFWNRVF